MGGFFPSPGRKFFGPSGPLGPNLIAGNFLATFNPSSTTYVFSKDGTSWSTGTTPAAGLGMAFGGTGTPKWVMVKDGSSSDVMTSPDGVTWTTQVGVLPTASTWVDVAWSPTLGLFAAINNNNANRVATSPDGITWTARTVPGFTIFKMEWLARFAKFFAFESGFNTTAGISSADGITWNTVTPSAACNSQYPRDFGGSFGMFGLAPESTSYCYSTDGITFTQKSTPTFPGSGSNTTGVCIVVGGTVFSFTGSGGTSSLIKSSQADLTSGWSLQAGGSGFGSLQGNTQAAIKSQALGLWALTAGVNNVTQVLTTTDGIAYTLFNPTNAVASTLARMAVAA